MWPGNILLLLFKYFQLLSNTIYSMNSTESKRNKPELIQNREGTISWQLPTYDQSRSRRQTKLYSKTETKLFV